ncbi:hypothetical protein [Lysinibacillus xylanilyticus]|uniref:hypothetical protein n=1 Tax=Lysinibacillus xylanilyticus TaxID=582475 RepID=UPI0037F1E913
MNHLGQKVFFVLKRSNSCRCFESVVLTERQQHDVFCAKAERQRHDVGHEGVITVLFFG